MGVLQLHGELVHSNPRSCIHLGVVNRHREFQVVMVNAVELFLDAQSVTDWTASNIEPDSVFRHHPDRLDDERGIVRPLAHRIAIKPWLTNFLAHLYASLNHFGELSPVRPNDAPRLRIFVQDRYLVLVLKDLRLPQVIKIRAREAYRLTLIPGIIIKCWENLIGPD